MHKAREQGFDIEALPASPNDVGQVKMLRAYPYYAYESVDGTKMESPTKIHSNNANECISQIENEIKTGEYKKDFSKDINNRAYKQQEVGQLEKFFFTIPQTLTKEELEEILKRYKKKW